MIYLDNISKKKDEEINLLKIDLEYRNNEIIKLNKIKEQYIKDDKISYMNIFWGNGEPSSNDVNQFVNNIFKQGRVSALPKLKIVNVNYDLKSSKIRYILFTFVCVCTFVFNINMKYIYCIVHLK